jgi:hypothetical protein
LNRKPATAFSITFSLLCNSVNVGKHAVARSCCTCLSQIDSEAYLPWHANLVLSISKFPTSALPRQVRPVGGDKIRTSIGVIYCILPICLPIIEKELVSIQMQVRYVEGEDCLVMSELFRYGTSAKLSNRSHIYLHGGLPSAKTAIGLSSHLWLICPRVDPKEKEKDGTQVTKAESSKDGESLTSVSEKNARWNFFYIEAYLKPWQVCTPPPSCYFLSSQSIVCHKNLGRYAARVFNLP